MSAYVFDIEGNGFLYEATKLHCIVLVDIETKVLTAYHDTELYPRHGSLAEGFTLLEEADAIIGHNITGYDVPIIGKLHPEVDIYNPVLVDTQKIAELFFPEIKKQGIEAWIKLLQLPDPKIHIDDFSELSQALLNRCVGDVKNNLAIYEYLKRNKAEQEADGSSFNVALETEQEVSLIHSQQVLHGVWYDVDLAIETAKGFADRMDELQEKVQELAPPIMSIPSLSQEKQKAIQSASKSPYFKDVLPGIRPWRNLKFTKGQVINPFLKNGSYANSIIKYFSDVSDPFSNEYLTVKGEFCKVTFDPVDIYDYHTINYFGFDHIWSVKGEYSKVRFDPLNCSSDTQVKDFLLSLGWIPIEYNKSKKTGEKTSPKITEESFISLPPGLGQDIAEYRVLQHRKSLIVNTKDPENKGALSKVRSDHRVPADAFTCGTPTARYRHSGAVCNIPRPKSKLGKEIRRLYGVGPGHLQIGIDLSGIEARMLCHFCYGFEGGPEFAELVLCEEKGGDWHSANARMWGCTRDEAKTELYALMYGAGHAKLGATLGKSPAVGKKNKDKFMKAYKCYHQLVAHLEAEYEKNGGFIYGLDGRKFYVRNKKDVLNTLLQGNSAIVFKNWMIECDQARAEFVKQHNVELRQIIAYHDELQFELYEDNQTLAEVWGKIATELATKVGKRFKLNLKLAAEAKIGINWSDTH